MGKMKEVFMKIHYPSGDWDLEREYLINDCLAQETQYLEYQKLIEDQDLNTNHSKIEVENGRKTRIEVNEEESKLDREIKTE